MKYFTLIFSFNLAIFTSFFVCTLKAQESGAQPSVLLLNLSCNHSHTSQIVYALSDEDNQLWIEEQACHTCQFSPNQARTKIYQSRIYYLLSDLDQVSFELNNSELSLNLNISPEILPLQKIDLNPLCIDTVRPEHPGVYINYDLTLQREDLSHRNYAALLTDLIIFNPWGVGESTQLVQRSRYKNRNYYPHHLNHQREDLVRLNTRWTLDMPEVMSTWRVGDGITSTVIWSGAVRFGGIQYASNFATQPGFVPYPLPAFEGEAIVPSAVNFYLDNQLRSSQQVGGGPFHINGLPVITGASDITVQTQDIMGRDSIVTIPYYVSQQFLQPGLCSFSYEMGIIRHNYGYKSNDYEDFLAVGTFQKGITAYWTGGWHAELQSDQQTFGLNSGFILFNYLESQFALAMSQRKHRIGGLFLAGLRRLTPLYSYGAQVIGTSQDFRQIGFLRHHTPRFIVQANVNYNDPCYGTFGVSYTRRLGRAQQNLFERIDPNYLERMEPEILGLQSKNFLDEINPSISLTTLSYNKTIYKNLFLILNYLHQTGKIKNDTFFASLVWSPFYNHTASFNYERNRDQYEATFAYSKNLPTDNGFGFHLMGSTGRNPHQEADLSLQTDHGLYRALISHIADTNNYELDASGSLLHFMHQTFLSRKIDNSFVLARVPCIEDIAVYYNNQIIGQTNKDGYYLIPQTLPYQDNIISINPVDLPLNTLIGDDALITIPYYRSGAYIEFPVVGVHHLTFSLYYSDQTPVEPGTIVILENGNQYPVGYDGKVFISETDPPSVLSGTINSEDKACYFEADLSQSNEIIQDLGIIQCKAE